MKSFNFRLLVRGVVGLIAAMLLILIPVQSRADEHPVTLALVSTEVLAGSEVTIPVILSVPEEAHTLIFDIEYIPDVFTLISATRGDYPISDDAMFMCIPNDREGICSVGILCPTAGMTGSGTLMELRFRAASTAWGAFHIRVNVRECLYAPLGSDYTELDVLAISADVRVILPNASAALRVLRGVIGLLDMPEWADADCNNVVNTDDVLWILRRLLACD